MASSVSAQAAFVAFLLRHFRPPIAESLHFPLLPTRIPPRCHGWLILVLDAIELDTYRLQNKKQRNDQRA